MDTTRLDTSLNVYPTSSTTSSRCLNSESLEQMEQKKIQSIRPQVTVRGMKNPAQMLGTTQRSSSCQKRTFPIHLIVNPGQSVMPAMNGVSWFCLKLTAIATRTALPFLPVPQEIPSRHAAASAQYGCRSGRRGSGTGSLRSAGRRTSQSG